MTNNVNLKINRYICGKGLSMRRTIIVIMMFYAMLNCIADISVTQSMYLPSQNVVAEFMAVESYGGLFGESASRQSYKYSGKELERMNGLNTYDFHARPYYYPVLQFHSPDLLGEKTPWLSPYLYCAGNPVMFIDPTGMDIWRLNNQGYVVDVEETTEYDKLEMIDNEEKSIKFEHGTIISQKSYEYKDGKTYDVWKVRGDENATQMFAFMSDNITGSDSNVEIGLAQTGIAGDKGLNFITTGHARGREPGFSNLWYNQLGYLYNIRTHTHSHPSDTNPSGGDIQFVKGVINHLNDNKPLFNNKWYMAMPKFRIYHVPTKKYINYNQNGVIK